MRKKETFNLIQRGHQNALETLPHFLAFSLIGGMKHPLVVAGAGVLWCIGRVLFQKGYTEGENKRYSKGGGLHYIGLFVSGGAAISFALSQLKLV